MKIFLNPGHDRQLDSGAVNRSIYNGTREADVVWDVSAGIANNIQTILENNGIEVITAQSNDLGSVVYEANEWGADLFVSVHCNAFNGVASGTETEVYSFGSLAEELARKVNDSIVSNIGTVDRGLKERPGLYVLNSTDMPAILIEMAFIDNDNDCAHLVNRKGDFAKAITDGIFAYLGMMTLSSTDSVDLRKVAPNGKPYEENDVLYLTNQGYTRAQALSILDMDVKYRSNSINIRAAADYAETRVGSTGYGNNGCTAWVRDFLLKANHPFGKLMQDGTAGNLMWVPNIMDYAKANNLWKEPEEGGSCGDICLLETNYCRSDGPDHVVICCGDGDYWGNSSSRNKIVRSSIAYDYGEENVWGYVSTGSAESGAVVSGSSSRSLDEIVGDAGSTSYVNLAPNGKVYEENDIQYLLGEGYTYEGAIDELKKDPKYTEFTVPKAPNGKYYEQNDIQFLLNNDYTYEAAINLLSQIAKYNQ